MNQKLTIGKLAEWGGGTPADIQALCDHPVGKIGTDSRLLGDGDLFVALTTDNDDGHRYVSSAFEKGAVAAVVARSRAEELSAQYPGRLIVVADPLEALQRMAAAYRTTLGIDIIALTGSNGKTSTRRMIATVLKMGHTVGETAGNFNNHIGVPLSLLSFQGDEQVGVLELGANHVGEIRVLTQIVKPDIALITNIGYAHVGNFGSLEKTLEAKWEITEGIVPGGSLLLNGDDERLRTKAAQTKVDAVFYGFSAECDVRATNIRLGGDLQLHFTVFDTEFELSTAARHMIYNALPAIELGRRFGMDMADIAAQLKRFAPADMRGVIESKHGIRFIVDCYNANPSSMAGALQMLQDVAGGKRSIAVVGDMLELGELSTELHRDLGRRIGAMGIDGLVAVGEWADAIAEGARESGMGKEKIRVSANSDEAVEETRALARKGDTVLLKASRRVHLETVYERI